MPFKPCTYLIIGVTLRISPKYGINYVFSSHFMDYLLIEINANFGPFSVRPAQFSKRPEGDILNVHMFWVRKKFQVQKNYEFENLLWFAWGRGDVGSSKYVSYLSTQ